MSVCPSPGSCESQRPALRHWNALSVCGWRSWRPRRAPGRFYSPVIAALVLRMCERMFCIERRLCAIALLIKHQEMRWWMKRWTLLKLLSHEPIWGDSDKTELVLLYLNSLPLFNRSDGINVNERPHLVIGLWIKSQTDFIIRSSFCHIDCFDSIMWKLTQIFKIYDSQKSIV